MLTLQPTRQPAFIDVEPRTNRARPAVAAPLAVSRTSSTQCSPPRPARSPSSSLRAFRIVALRPATRDGDVFPQDGRRPRSLPHPPACTDPTPCREHTVRSPVESRKVRGRPSCAGRYLLCRCVHVRSFPSRTTACRVVRVCSIAARSTGRRIATGPNHDPGEHDRGVGRVGSQRQRRPRCVRAPAAATSCVVQCAAATRRCPCERALVPRPSPQTLRRPLVVRVPAIAIAEPAEGVELRGLTSAQDQGMFPSPSLSHGGGYRLRRDVRAIRVCRYLVTESPRAIICF